MVNDSRQENLLPKKKSLKYIFLFLFVYIFTALFWVVVCIVGLMIAPIKTYRFIFSERIFKRKMKEQNRILEWNAVQKCLDREEGSVVVEWGFHGPWHVWWLNTSLKDKFPDLPLVPLYQADIQKKEFYEDVFNETMNQWAEEHLHPCFETACLVKIPQLFWKTNPLPFPKDKAYAIGPHCKASPSNQCNAKK